MKQNNEKLPQTRADKLMPIACQTLSQNFNINFFTLNIHITPPPAHTYMPREFPQPHTTPPWLPLLVSPQLTRGVKNSQEKQSDSAVSFSTTLCMYLRKSAATLFLPACV